MNSLSNPNVLLCETVRTDAHVISSATEKFIIVIYHNLYVRYRLL